MANLLAAKAADGSPSSDISGERRKQAPKREVQYKLELVPNEIKLDGVGNYLSWSRRGMLIFRMKSIEGYVLGNISEARREAGRGVEEMKCYGFTGTHLIAEFLDTCCYSTSGSAFHVNRGMGCPVKDVFRQGKCYAGLSD